MMWLNSSFLMVISVSGELLGTSISFCGMLMEKVEMVFLISKACSEKKISMLVGKTSIFIYFPGAFLIKMSPFSKRETLVSIVSFFSA